MVVGASPFKRAHPEKHDPLERAWVCAALHLSGDSTACRRFDSTITAVGGLDVAELHLLEQWQRPREVSARSVK